MPIPKYDEMYRAFLDCLADGQLHKSKEVKDAVAGVFSVSEKERAEMLPSGKQQLFDNRIGWTRTYLKKAGIVQSPAAGGLCHVICCGFCLRQAWPAAKARQSPPLLLFGPSPMPFTALGLAPSLAHAAASQGLIAPTPVQSQSIPAVLDGQDLRVCAPTGSGKTAAYVLPLLQAWMLGDAGSRHGR